MKNASKRAAISSHEWQALQEEHKSLDDRLRTLTRRAYLTPREQQEAALIKRMKLVAKDRMRLLSLAEAAE